MSRTLGLLQLAREVEGTAQVVARILRMLQAHAGNRALGQVPAPRGRARVEPVRPGEVRRVQGEYIPPGKLKRKKK